MTNEFREAYRLALRALLRRTYTAHDMRQWLYRKGMAMDVVDRCIERLQEERYIDDRRWAQSYVYEQTVTKKRGKRQIVRGMQQKGVDDETIADVVEEIQPEEERNVAVQWARKKWRGRSSSHSQSTIDAINQRNRLMAGLLRRGFDISVARWACDVVLQQDQDERIP